MLSSDTIDNISSAKNWYVLYTKPRHEKKLAERMVEDGWTVLLPPQKVHKEME